MPPFLKNRPLMILMIVSVILIATMLITSGDRNSLTGVENVIGGFFSPIQGVMYRVTTGVADFFQGIFDQKDLEKEYAKLKDKIVQLESDNRRLGELERENKRLKGLLDYTEDHPEYKTVSARVIGKNPGNWFNVFVIDKGKKDGVTKDMAVVSEKGLIGRVMEAGSNWAKVLSIVDSRSSVSGIIERTRDHGMVRGNNNLSMEDGLCKMIFLPLETDLIPGDKVMTSGLGGIFPKGILIGEVQEVSRQQNELQKYAIVKPSVDFLHLEEVLVIKADVENIQVE